MKFLLITFALIGLATAQLLDSATQGPNPQDIATPEPEYIDIDVPESAGASAPAPPPIQPRVFAPVPIARPVQRPIIAPAPIISQQHFAPQRSFHATVQQHHQLPGHTFSHQNGYQYRRPVYFRRVYRRRRY